MSYSGAAKYAPLGSISEELYDSTFNIQPRLDARRSWGFGLVEGIYSWRAWITPCRNPVSRTPVDQT
jgi:hypothetical protein